MKNLNKNKLKSKMILHGDTNEMLANALGCSPQRFSMKINEKDGAEFNQGEIQTTKERYSLTAKEVDEIFFS